ncbi:HIT family protein [Ureaplasma ceti]|uniref:HIT family protein n=1 Tax=Ureaplasma ceti TaxID=3119530 RepID=A0ABP9UB43_9BACT
MENCIFCKIVAGEIPAKVVGENEGAIAFLDINPNTLGHTLVIPKAHFDNFSSADANSLQAVSSLAAEVAQKMKTSELKAQGVNYLSNEGEIAGQVVNHFHLHVIPKYQVGIGLNFKNVKLDDEVINQDLAYNILKAGK